MKGSDDNLSHFENELKDIRKEISILNTKIENDRAWTWFFTGTTIAFAGYAMYLAFFVD